MRGTARIGLKILNSTQEPQSAYPTTTDANFILDKDKTWDSEHSFTLVYFYIKNSVFLGPALLCVAGGAAVPDEHHWCEDRERGAGRTRPLQTRARQGAHIVSPSETARDLYLAYGRVQMQYMFHVKNNYLCTYDLYSPVRNCFDAGRYIMWGGGGRGVGAGNREFLGPLK